MEEQSIAPSQSSQGICHDGWGDVEMFISGLEWALAKGMLKLSWHPCWCCKFYGHAAILVEEMQVVGQLENIAQGGKITFVLAKGDQPVPPQGTQQFHIMGHVLT